MKKDGMFAIVILFLSGLIAVTWTWLTVVLSLVGHEIPIKYDYMVAGWSFAILCPLFFIALFTGY